MNDPTVKALHYRIKHSQSVDYDKAEAVEYDHDLFTANIKGKMIRISPKHHYPTEEDARNSIEPVVLAWELDAGLNRQPDHFEPKFMKSDIVDRNPPPGTIQPDSLVAFAEIGTPSIHINIKSYPRIPSGLGRDLVTDRMYKRYALYRLGKETISATAYFCLTVLETSSGGRSGIAKKYGISSAITNTIGRLTGDKGGSIARKSSGAEEEYTASELEWLHQAIKLMIRRAAEIAFDGSNAKKMLTKKDLPPLK